MASDPFNRKSNKISKRGFWEDGKGPKGPVSYPGQTGIEYLFGKSTVLLLVRTDPRVDCVCADQMNKTGDLGCLRCLGTGKLVRSLDRFRGYVAQRKSRNPDQAGPMGWTDTETRYVYTGRWLYPNVGDILIEVSWNKPHKDALSEDVFPKVIDKIWLCKYTEFPGFEQIAYTIMTVVSAETKRPHLDRILLNADLDVLPPYRVARPEDEVV
jgi:hypothetical protein